MDKPTILICLPYYLPISETGPVQSITNLINALNDEFNFRILTTYESSENKKCEISKNSWNCVDEVKVYYASSKSFVALKDIFDRTEFDILYLNSFFHFDLTIKPLLLRWFSLIPKKPVVLAPRGQFSPGALEIKSIKKRLFISLLSKTSLYKEILWQASTEDEVSNIKRSLGKDLKVIEAKNIPLPKEIKFNRTREKKEGWINILFLSRIVQKKNLDYALEVIADVKAEVRFDIVGPTKDKKYWSKCKKLMSSLPKNVIAEYKGSVGHDEVYNLMANYDLFFLPTKGENYGHVIQEALSVGLPVLISDQTPWKNLEESNVGWSISLQKKRKFQKIIEHCANKSEKDYVKWRKEIMHWEKERQMNENFVEQNKKLFMQSLVQ